MRALVGNRAFRRLWLAGTLFRLAAGLRRVAVPWLVLVRTGSPLQLGIALAVGSLDLLATPLVGPLVDRHRRRTVVAGSLVGYGMTLLALPALAAVDALTTHAVYVALFLLGVSHFAYHNARHAWVPELVAELDAANAAIHGVGAAGSALFVAAGGAITTLTTPLTAVGGAGVAALAALVPLVGLPESTDHATDSPDDPTPDDPTYRDTTPTDASSDERPTTDPTAADSTPDDATDHDIATTDSSDEGRPRNDTDRRDERAVSGTPEARGVAGRLVGYLQETRAGLQAVGRHGLWPLVGASVGINLVAPAYGLLFAAVGDRFGTALAYAALVVGYDLGKVAGNAVVPRLDWSRVLAVRRGIALLGLTTLAFGSVGWLLAGGRATVAVPLLAVGTAVVGATQPVFNVPSDGLVQRAVPDADRGTVVTVTNALYQLPFPLAYLGGGLLAERLSPFTGFVVAGAFLLVVASLAAVTLDGQTTREPTPTATD